LLCIVTEDIDAFTLLLSRCYRRLIFSKSIWDETVEVTFFSIAKKSRSGNCDNASQQNNTDGNLCIPGIPRTIYSLRIIEVVVIGGTGWF
jgi:hypothetical protein